MMPQNDHTLLVLLTTWIGTPWDYYHLRFDSDGSGNLVLGYGQWINVMVDYQFEIKSPNLMRLMQVSFSSTLDSLPPKTQDFVRGHWLSKLFEAEFNVWREIRFELLEGDYRGNQNMGTGKGPFTYNFHWLLKFERPPFPEGVKLIYGTPSQFYGHGSHCNSVDTPSKRRWWQFWK